jgi:hypothetical protein
MANLTCTQRLKVCHLRVIRLSAVGAVLPGADSLYEYSAPVTFGYTPTAPERERIEQLNGCGDQCGLYQGGPKAVDGAELSLALCNQDAELLELLTGGSIVTEGTGTPNTIGYLSPTDATVDPDGVAIELWSIAWNGKQRAVKGGQPAWYRHTFTKVRFSYDEQTFATDEFGLTNLTGLAEVNSGFGTGLATDPWPTSMGSSVFGWFVDDAKPANACGYQTVA